jgi:hypothetical protein
MARVADFFFRSAGSFVVSLGAEPVGIL